MATSSHTEMTPKYSSPILLGHCPDVLTDITLPCTHAVVRKRSGCSQRGFGSVCQNTLMCGSRAVVLSETPNKLFLLNPLVMLGHTDSSQQEVEGD